MSDLDVAIIGMAGRFPQAEDITAFWRNIAEARECQTFFSRDAMIAAGYSPDVVDAVDFIGVRGVLGSADRFDAAFFGYSPREAQFIDPQHRIFLEVAWNAFENAGYAPDRFAVPVGVFASCSQNTYRDKVLPLIDADGHWQDRMLAGIGNQIEFLSSRVSYKLNLTGPSMTVQTACSSSLVAFHLACQSLLSGECDVALTGGVAVRFPQESGQRYVEGGVYAPDGRCRAYMADARGVFSGNGAAAVVLKRLDDAIAAGDWIYGVVKATAVNNDGGDKIGFTAPSESGQVAVIRTALELAGLGPSDIGYVEGHGTGTPLGDSIEIAALRTVFDEVGATDPFCALGSVKSNIGHLDAAAGIAGILKATLAVHHGVIPPHPHRSAPALALTDGDNRSFYLADAARKWPASPKPRAAAVTALGLGGTNAHLVVTSGPVAAHDGSVGQGGIGGHFLAPVSAASAASLSAMLDTLPADLKAARDRQLTTADVSATLMTGRSLFPHRAVVFGRDLDEIAAAASNGHGHGTATGVCEETDADVVFMYPGGGSQYRGMARGLLTDRVFAEEIDTCRTALYEATGVDLIADVLGGDADLDDPVTGLGALHLVQVALARTYLRRGVQATSQIGHSLGEYTAAVIGGAISPVDGLRLVVKRAALLAEVPGAMVSVLAAPEALQAKGYLDDLSLAAVNAPEICTLSGSRAAVDVAVARLAAEGIDAKPVPITVPGHSTLLTRIADRFRAELRNTSFTTPSIPWISNITGKTITPNDLADPEYWVRHLMTTVRFGDGVTTLLAAGARNFLEVGPGQTLSAFVRANARPVDAVKTFRSMRSADEETEDGEVLAQSFAELYCSGVQLEPRALYGLSTFRKVPMSGYRFERVRHWPAVRATEAQSSVDGISVLPEPASWLTTPGWTRLPERLVPLPQPERRLVFLGLELSGAEGDVARVASPDELSAVLDGSVRLVLGPKAEAIDVMTVVRTAFQHLEPSAVDVVLVTSSAVRVEDDDPIVPERAGVISALRVLGQEHARLRWQVIDVPSPEDFAAAVMSEIVETPNGTVRAIRSSGRWEQVLVPTDLDESLPIRTLRENGTYVFTGGLGRFSLHIARHLCATRAANVVLTTRRQPEEAVNQLPKLTAAAFGRLLREHADQIRVIRCDVEDERALARVFDDLDPIAGVFHAAAVSSGPSIRALGLELSSEDFTTQERPKLHGARALAQALHGREYEFCFLFSSNASRFGGAGRSAYAAANGAMEAFVTDRWRGGDHRWVTASWDGWRLDDEPVRSTTTPLDRLALSASEAVAAVETIVTKAQTAVTVVSKGDVRDRYDRWVRDVAKEITPEHTTSDECAYTPSRFSTDLEEEIADLWREVLGIAPTNPQDGFFAVGGNSLMGLRLVSRIKDRYEVPFEYAVLVEHNTLGETARWIAARSSSAAVEPDVADVPSRTLSELLTIVKGSTT